MTGPIRHTPSPNHDSRPPGTRIDGLVLHYTGMQSGQAALARLCDPQAEVSAHYLLEEDGTLYQLVAEAERAWHAGQSFWRGRAGLNANTIGIEIVNPGHAFGYRPFPPAQMHALRTLCRAILARHPIDPRNLVAHSDIAPDRKQDPGELFDWPFLAQAGIGMYPTASLPPRADATTLMAAIGYDTSRAGCVVAFQRRFAPDQLGAGPNRATLGRLQAVADAYATLFPAAPLPDTG